MQHEEVVALHPVRLHRLEDRAQILFEPLTEIAPSTSSERATAIQVHEDPQGSRNVVKSGHHGGQIPGAVKE
jgi:hypothetical protein